MIRSAVVGMTSSSYTLAWIAVLCWTGDGLNDAIGHWNETRRLLIPHLFSDMFLIISTLVTQGMHGGGENPMASSPGPPRLP